jgi:hypothetical protein
LGSRPSSIIAPSIAGNNKSSMRVIDTTVIAKMDCAGFCAGAGKLASNSHKSRCFNIFQPFSATGGKALSYGQFDA